MPSGLSFHTQVIRDSPLAGKVACTRTEACRIPKEAASTTAAAWVACTDTACQPDAVGMAAVVGFV
eukprot:NODE_16124_length_1011_cov_2.514706.p4 GENE.NODE_16124_length_1011_cov_2.514706~~NODE_16124_length_1011_cov_2.514706.p4  ORF type:complete len:66 (-),score=5.87 NODE_16124_length_1011_cov_2.514706:368-565(-)